MNETPCVCPDLNLMDLGGGMLGAFSAYPDDRYPRRTWWKFWERPRTRDDWLKDLHQEYMREGKCHQYSGLKFHFCGKDTEGLIF